MTPAASDTLAERLLAGDQRALARAITLVESDDPRGWELVREVYPHTGKASIVGCTGPPGAGKSTLVSSLTTLRREQGRSVGVLSIDPSSPFTQGALLGDRIRLTEHFLDQGVFIRSMANRGALGGLSEAALQTALLMDAAGRQDIFLETVGVGQAEVDIIDHADTVVLVLVPGSGDSIQALKAGVMEIPDIIVVNKCDHPNANPARVRQQLQEKGLTPDEWGGTTLFVDCSAVTKQGIDKLLEMIVFQTDLLELKANPDRKAKGNVIESGLQAGGPTATVLVRKGTLKVGDVILCGSHHGRVRALINEEGERLKIATPSVATARRHGRNLPPAPAPPAASCEPLHDASC